MSPVAQVTLKTRVATPRGVTPSEPKICTLAVHVPAAMPVGISCENDNVVGVELMLADVVAML